MSKEKIYEESGLESLLSHCWSRKLSLFYKVLENENPKCLFNLNPIRRLLYLTWNIHNILFLNTKHNFFQKFFFFSSTVIERNNLDPHYRKLRTFQFLKIMFISLSALPIWCMLLHAHASAHAPLIWRT